MLTALLATGLLAGPAAASVAAPTSSAAAPTASAAAPTSSAAAPTASAATPLAVRVGRTVVSNPIPPGFLGFSFEFKAVRDYTGSDPRAINPVLVQLIRNLNPGQAPVLRIGGNSTDNTWWPTSGVTPTPGITYALTPSWLATTRALAEKLDAQLILGVNLKLDSVSEALAEARAYRSGIPSRYISELEIGNEPELYRVFPWYGDATGTPFYARPATYDFAAYAQDVAQIASRLRKFAFAGPATGSRLWLSHLPALFAAEPRLKVVTYHRYPLLACFTTPVDPHYPTIANLLKVSSARDLLQGAASSLAFAHSHGASFRLDELNSVSCKGQSGVSDTFASALWMLDTLFALARAHVDGVNIHTLPDAVYKPFTFSRAGGRWLAAVAPDYYALLTFAQAAPPGSRMLAVSTPPGGDLRARATIARDGAIRVVLINDSLTTGHLVHLSAPSGLVPTATVERLRAPSASATSGVTLGGQSFGDETATGRLEGTPLAGRLKPVHGRYRVRLPASSAVLVTFSPAAA